MIRAHRRFVREDSGQEIIEFALASFVFFMTIFGTLEFGMAVWRYNMVSNLAQEGARWASVRGSTSSISHASQGDVQTFVQSRSAGVPVTVTTVPASVGDPGSTFSVTARTSFAPLTALIPFTTITLQSTSTMVVAR